MKQEEPRLLCYFPMSPLKNKVSNKLSEHVAIESAIDQGINFLHETQHIKGFFGAETINDSSKKKIQNESTFFHTPLIALALSSFESEKQIKQIQSNICKFIISQKSES